MTRLIYEIEANLGYVTITNFIKLSPLFPKGFHMKFGINLLGSFRDV